MSGRDQAAHAIVPRWLLTIERWLQTKTPSDFGYFRSCWSCAALAETLDWEAGIRFSGELSAADWHAHPGKRRNTRLFLEHLDGLRRALRSYRNIHVMCDNADFHHSRAVKQCLARWRTESLSTSCPSTRPKAIL